MYKLRSGDIIMRILLILFFSISTIYGQTSRTPEEVVKYALNALTNGDIEKLITVTEHAELRQAKELLATVGGDEWKKNELLKQYRSLKSWSVVESAEHDINGRKIAVVSTEWIILASLENNPKNIAQGESSQRTVFVDYMLEKFDNQWKIISRKSLN